MSPGDGGALDPPVTPVTGDAYPVSKSDSGTLDAVLERALWLERVDAAELRAERVEARLDQVLDLLLDRHAERSRVTAAYRLWRRASSLNNPPRRISSSWVPDSITCPPFRT